MKIGLLTITPSHNYGGILQTLALYKYLQMNGHDVILINKKNKIPYWKKKTVEFLEKVPYQNINKKRQTKKKYDQLKPFLKKHLHKLTKPIFTTEDLKKEIEENCFEAIIVGSDQVWRYQYINDGHYQLYFLDFEVDFPIKKIAYAASFGTDTWEAPLEVSKVAELLKKFDAISTREASGITLCKQVFSISNCKCVLDPTLMVGRDFYKALISESTVIEEQKTIVTYILDPDEKKSRYINRVKSELEDGGTHDFKVVNLAERNNNKYYSVEDWLWHINNAGFVITDSFHGMAFSILFQRQFVVIGNIERGLSRFASLLNALSLPDRLEMLGPQLSVNIKKTIHYESVNNRLESLRRESVEYLLESLKEGM